MDHARIIGLKDSSGNMIYMHRMIEMLKHRPDWTLLVGPEELLSDCVLAGGHGGVSGGANVFPRLYVDLYEAASRGDLARTRELQSKVLEVSGKLYRLGDHASSYIKGIKTALSLLGICDDGMAEPCQRFETQDRARVQATLKELQTLVG
jgi:4-hydroxy-tetrahydrodipicolinate synthase